MQPRGPQPPGRPDWCSWWTRCQVGSVIPGQVISLGHADGGVGRRRQAGHLVGGRRAGVGRVERVELRPHVSLQPAFLDGWASQACRREALRVSVRSAMAFFTGRSRRPPPVPYPHGAGRRQRETSSEPHVRLILIPSPCRETSFPTWPIIVRPKGGAAPWTRGKSGRHDGGPAVASLVGLLACRSVGSPKPAPSRHPRPLPSKQGGRGSPQHPALEDHA